MTKRSILSPGPLLVRATLLSAVAGLAWVNWKMAEATLDTTPLRTDRLQTVDTAQPLDLATRLDKRPLSTLAETVNRPVFASTRRPQSVVVEAPEAKPQVAAAPAPEPDPPPSAEGFRLLGTMQLGRASKRALIRPGEGDKPVWLEEGGDVGGWRLTSIGASGVVIEAGDTKVELKLYER